MDKQNTLKKYKIDAAALKYIAIITMLIDHTAASLIGLVPFITENYKIMRSIGRIAFPIFAFLLVEGFYKTKDRKKYTKNMMIFALISEIPYNYMLTGKFFDLNYQNIYFTLTLGLLMMYMLEIHKNFIFKIIIVVTTALIAEFIIKSDYGIFGIIPIAVFYSTYNEKDKINNFLMYELAYAFEFNSLVHIANILLAFFYNGKRGKQNKYFFYAFYPGHLLVLMLIRMYLTKGM